MEAEPHAPAHELVDHLFRNRAGQMVAYLTRLLGPEHLSTAEEVVQEALLKALQTWPYSGTPENPAGWLFRVARNAALDALKHQKLVTRKSAELGIFIEGASAFGAPGDPDFEEQLRDDELRMVLMCCHPALSRDARVALSLKTVGGFSTREIARAFLSLSWGITTCFAIFTALLELCLVIYLLIDSRLAVKAFQLVSQITGWRLNLAQNQITGGSQ